MDQANPAVQEAPALLVDPECKKKEEKNAITSISSKYIFFNVTCVVEPNLGVIFFKYSDNSDSGQ